MLDRQGTIVGWSDGARSELGYAPGDVMGKRCHEVFRGCDIYGNPRCNASCPLLEVHRQGGSVRPHELVIRRANGSREVYCCVASSVRGSHGVDHVFYQLHRGRLLGTEPKQPAEVRADSSHLTHRERETLDLLALGRTSKEIGKALGIRHATVRNHVQRVLVKLGVHSRLEAVAIAFERNLLSRPIQGS